MIGEFFKNLLDRAKKAAKALKAKVIAVVHKLLLPVIAQKVLLPVSRSTSCMQCT